MKGRGGFTLLELLVVMIIISILAALAIPRFLVGTEAAKCTEAKRFLGSIREAEVTYQQTTGGYTNSLNDLGVSAIGTFQSSTTCINSKYWNFYINISDLSGALYTNFNAVAVRRNNQPDSNPYATQDILINASGNIWGSHVIGNKIGG